MRMLITLLILILSFQSWAKADEISEFEIEGMSIGDSLLEFFNEKDIKEEIKTAVFYPKSKKFMVISLIQKQLKIMKILIFI